MGDNVVTNPVNRIVAGSSIRIRGDERRRPDGSVDPVDPDTDFGITMLLRGTIGYSGAPANVTLANPNGKEFTQIFGNADIDTFTFDQTRLDANTTVYGSSKSDGEVLLAHDGEDEFIVNQLRSMHVDRNGLGDTLTLDGQADTDYYVRQHHRQPSRRGRSRNYVINVLDTGAKDDGVDELESASTRRSDQRSTTTSSCCAA